MMLLLVEMPAISIIEAGSPQPLSVGNLRHSDEKFIYG